MPVVGLAVLALVIACFASGLCAFGAVVAGMGFATAAVVLGALRAAGIRDSGAGPSA